MARPKGDGVRHQIVLATFEQIAQRGVQGLTLRDVAAAAGLSNGTVTYHFGSKHRLLMDAIEYGYWRLPEGFEDLDAASALSWVLRRYVLADQKRRSWWQFWLAVTFHAQTDEQVRQQLDTQHASIVRRWRFCVERGMADADFRPDLDPELEARRLTAYAHGLAVSQLIDPTQTPWAELELKQSVDALRIHRS